MTLKFEVSTEIARLYVKGLKVVDVAKRVDCAPSTIASHLRKQEIQIDPRRYRHKRFRRDARTTERLYNEGFTLQEIGKRLGITYQAVAWRLQHIGVPRRTLGYYAQKRSYRPDQIKQAVELYEHHSVREVAKLQGCGVSTASRRIHLAGITPSAGRKNRNNLRHDPAVSATVARLYEDGVNHTDIAKTLGISDSAVYLNLDRRGVKRRLRRFIPDGEITSVVQLFDGGMTEEAIGRKLSLSSSQVRYRLRIANVR